MSKCLKPDERLLECPDREDIIHRVEELEEIYSYFKIGIYSNLGMGRLEGASTHLTPLIYTNIKNMEWYGIELYIEFHRVAEMADREWDSYSEYVAKIANSILDRGCFTPYFAEENIEKSSGGGIREDRFLDRGWEIALPSLPIDKICEYIQAVISDRHISPYLRHNGNASMHVTVEPFDTPEQQIAFHDFWNNYSLFPDFYEVIRRLSSAPDTKQRRAYKFRKDGFMKADVEWEHIHRCSVRKNGAMEIRVFQAVYDIEVVRNQLLMVDIVNKAVRDGEIDYDAIKRRVYEQLKLKW